MYSDLAAILNLDPADEKKAFLLSFHVHNYSYPPLHTLHTSGLHILNEIQ